MGTVFNFFKSTNGLDQKLVELIMNEIVETKQSISWEDIAGLDDVKEIFKTNFINKNNNL